MSKWRVTLSFDREYEADDEGDALMQADSDCSIMTDGRAQELRSAEDDSDDDDGNWFHDADMESR